MGVKDEKVLHACCTHAIRVFQYRLHMVYHITIPTYITLHRFGQATNLGLPRAEGLTTRHQFYPPSRRDTLSTFLIGFFQDLMRSFSLR